MAWVGKSCAAFQQQISQMAGMPKGIVDGAGSTVQNASLKSTYSNAGGMSCLDGIETNLLQYALMGLR